MEDRDINEFSWQPLFFVTGISFVLFSLVVKFLDGAHSVAMLWIGAISLSLGVIIWAIDMAIRTPVRKNKKYTS